MIFTLDHFIGLGTQNRHQSICNNVCLLCYFGISMSNLSNVALILSILKNIATPLLIKCNCSQEAVAIRHYSWRILVITTTNRKATNRFRFVAVSVVAVSVCGRYDLLPFLNTRAQLRSHNSDSMLSTRYAIVVGWCELVVYLGSPISLKITTYLPEES